MITRRDLLKSSAALSVTLATADVAAGTTPGYGGFRMGMESFSLRKFDLDKTLAMYRELAIPYAEFVPENHMPVTTDVAAIKGYRAKLNAAGITAWALWGEHLTKDPETSRTTFMFAKAMGAKLLVGTPALDGFDAMERNAKEYGVRVAIHNHGPKSRYSTIADVARALEGRGENVGACVDTGHFIHSGQDPVQAIRQFGSRVLEVHLKDSGRKVLGQGKLDVVGTLRALKAVKFSGCLALEYEENPDNPMDDLKACMAKLREALGQM